jgi:hypothetical protein
MTADLSFFLPGRPNFANPGGTGGSGSNTIAVQDDGTPINTASTLNFTGSGVTVTDAGGGVATVDIPSSGAIPTFKLVGVGDSPYTQLASDEYLVIDATGGNVVVNLLAVAAATSTLRAKVIGLGGGFTVTLNASGGETIDMPGSLVLSTLQQMVHLIPYVAGNRWLIS